MAGQRRLVEKLWQQFFSDPSQWWDHRPEKVNENGHHQNALCGARSQCIICWLWVLIALPSTRLCRTD